MMMTRRAPTRSRSLPASGAEIAAASVSVPNAVDAASLDHESAWQTSGMKMPNEVSGIVAKNALVLQAPTTRHPS